MAYCTYQDLERHLNTLEIAQLSAETGVLPDDEVVSDCIAMAEAEINAYLGVRYVLPLAEVPPRIKYLTIDLAIYHLFSRRNIVNELRRLRYQEAIEFLRLVAEGGAELPVSTGNQPQTETGAVYGFVSATRYFGPDDMQGY